MNSFDMDRLGTAFPCGRGQQAKGVCWNPLAYIEMCKQGTATAGLGDGDLRAGHPAGRMALLFNYCAALVDGSKGDVKKPT